MSETIESSETKEKIAICLYGFLDSDTWETCRHNFENVFTSDKTKTFYVFGCGYAENDEKIEIDSLFTDFQIEPLPFSDTQTDIAKWELIQLKKCYTMSTQSGMVFDIVVTSRFNVIYQPPLWEYLLEPFQNALSTASGCSSMYPDTTIGAGSSWVMERYCCQIDEFQDYCDSEITSLSLLTFTLARYGIDINPITFVSACKIQKHDIGMMAYRLSTQEFVPIELAGFELHLPIRENGETIVSELKHLKENMSDDEIMNEVINGVDENLSPELSLDTALIHAYNLTLPLEKRLDAVRFALNDNLDYLFEILAKLLAMFSYSNVGILRKYLFAVCNLNEVPLITRLDAIARMCCAPMNAEYAYEILGALCEELSERVGKDGVGDVSLVVYVDKLFLLISENDEKYGYLLEKIVCNTSIPITMRYAFVVQSKTLVDNEKFFKKMCFVILDLNENGIEKFQIMTCSNLIAYPESLSSEEFQNLVDKLFQWGENSILSENLPNPKLH